METKLFYLEDFTRLTCEAGVVSVTQENGKDIVMLDATVFYPQGGGQPYDTGVIESAAGKFVVEEVRMVDNIVRHIGHFDGNSELGNRVSKWKPGFQVRCRVDAARRLLHSRIHSAGHLVDWAVAELKPAWTPDPRGYHYPNGPYVTYIGSLPGEDKEKLKNDIEEACDRRIAAGEEVSIRFMNQDGMKKISRSVPDLPDGKPGRVIMFGNHFGVPCGGTHVRNLSEIHGLAIRKIKQEGMNIRIGYDVAP